MHFNLHKTFSTPHGGGGPGSGTGRRREKLVDYLPGPDGAGKGCGRRRGIHLVHPGKVDRPTHSFHGNFGMFVRALTYIRMHGEDGLRQISTDAVLNANYLKARLEGRLRRRGRPHRVCTKSSSRRAGKKRRVSKRSILPNASSISASTPQPRISH